MKLLLFLPFMLSILPSWAFPEVVNGPISSGGGMSVVCRNLNGKIQDSALLDVYEESSRGIGMKSASGNLRADFKILFQELRNSSNDKRPVEENDLSYLDILLSKSIFVDHKLPSTYDSGELRSNIPNNCRIEQLAYADDDRGRYYINREIWNSLDTMNQAALLFHEYLYEMGRVISEEFTSHKIRRVIGKAVSLDGLENMYEGAIHGQSVRCVAQRYATDTARTYVIFTNKSDTTVAQITQYFGFIPYSKQTYNFQKFNLSMLEKVDHDKVGRVLVPRNTDAKMIGKMYVGHNTLRGEKFAIEYFKDRPFLIAKLGPRNKATEIAYFTNCKSYHDWEY